MKAAVYGLLAIAVALAILATPMKALAHDHDRGWHHDHGHHYGWYKHHGWESYGYGGYAYPGYWRHYDDDWYRRRYGYWGYPGNMVCDHDGDRCWPASPVGPWGYGGYWPMSYSGPEVTNLKPQAFGI